MPRVCWTRSDCELFSLFLHSYLIVHELTYQQPRALELPLAEHLGSAFRLQLSISLSLVPRILLAGRDSVSIRETNLPSAAEVGVFSCSHLRAVEPLSAQF